MIVNLLFPPLLILGDLPNLRPYRIFISMIGFTVSGEVGGHNGNLPHLRTTWMELFNCLFLCFFVGLGTIWFCFLCMEARSVSHENRHFHQIGCELECAFVKLFPVIEISPMYSHSSGQIIATKPPIGHPNWWFSKGILRKMPLIQV